MIARFGGRVLDSRANLGLWGCPYLAGRLRLPAFGGEGSCCSSGGTVLPRAVAWTYSPLARSSSVRTSSSSSLRIRFWKVTGGR